MSINTAYLTTLAYCINAHCDPAAVPTWQRERFWASQVTGDSSLAPKWYYLEALERIKGTPSVEYNSSSTTPMNQTMLVPEANYDEQYKFNIMFDYIESLQARYW
ncbi:hypothetical protein H2203_004249 [Taxawa tesnikishii (nom. ined.)]|nr:hypothetical protein H2203_004249 [Dothideales sp. JES 119]